MQTILLTGCAGFIGSNFVRTIAALQNPARFKFIILDALTYAGRLDTIQDLLDQHQHLQFIKGDIRDLAMLTQLFKKYSFDGVINFAAESHVDRSIESPNIFVETNVLGTLNLLKESLSIFESKKNFKYIQISTDEVYGSLTMTDAPFTESTPIAPNSPYSASKASADLLCRAFFETYKLPVCITRCSNNYGPNQVEEKFIPLMIKRALADEPLPIYGSGLNVRDWIHVDDHNRGVWSVFEKGKAGEVYNFGGASERQNIEVAKEILLTLGKSESLLKYVEDRKGHDFRYAIDFSKSERELGWTPQVTFKTGLEETIAHFKAKWANKA